jgi:predicted 3-demethylubiquinone-9 3-methyltransferase (glyoxalase superfamily)
VKDGARLPAGSRVRHSTNERPRMSIFFIVTIAPTAGPAFRHTEAFSFQIATENQEETERYWNAIPGKGGTESQYGWCKDRWDLYWQITPR